MSRSLTMAEVLALQAKPKKTRGSGPKTDFTIRTANNWFSFEHIFPPHNGCQCELHESIDRPGVLVDVNGIEICRHCFLGSLDVV